jgi:hypothetical protein
MHVRLEEQAHAKEQARISLPWIGNLACYSCIGAIFWATCMHKDEWYFQVGYVEVLYVAMIVGIAVALYYFRRLKRVSALAASLIEEHSLLLGLLVLAVVLFVLNRVLGDLW